MAVTAKLYGNVFVAAFNKEIDFASDTVKVMLLNNTYVPDQDGHINRSNIVSSEVTGTGYTAGGVTLTGCTCTYAGGSNLITLDADDVEWTGSTITARYAAIYVSTGVDGTSPLICYIDFGEDVSSSSGTFSITFDAGGIVNVTVA